MTDLEIIRYEGDNETLVYKYSCEDLTTKSQLIVNESQEALFYKNGQALDLFPSGRHSLQTENLPFLKRIFSGLFGKGKPFPCDIYFVNKVHVLDTLWGTDAPVEIEDPKYSLLIGVRANGQTGIRIMDSRRFVVKVVGQLPDCSIDTVRRAVKGMLMSAVKEQIAKAIVEKQISILEITAHLSELSDMIMTRLNARVEDLGIALDHFSINTIAASDGDLDELRRAKNEMLAGRNVADIEAYQKAKVGTTEVDVEAYKMAKLGYTYADQRRYDVLETAAKNEGGAGAGFVNMGVGLGMGVGMAGNIGQMTNELLNNAQQNGAPAPAPTPAPAPAATIVCAECGAQIPADAKFCMSCGAKQEARPLFCPECGTQCAPGAKFCMNCGTKIGG